MSRGGVDRVEREGRSVGRSCVCACCAGGRARRGRGREGGSVDGSGEEEKCGIGEANAENKRTPSGLEVGEMGAKRKTGI